MARIRLICRIRVLIELLRKKYIKRENRVQEIKKTQGSKVQFPMSEKMMRGQVKTALKRGAALLKLYMFGNSDFQTLRCNSKV